MRLANIQSLAIDSVSNDMVVLLELEDSGELLPIWIGNTEAIAIALELSDVKPPRPMTHDLLVNILSGFDIALQRVRITALVDNTYYALLYLAYGDKVVVVDCRPSDSIALAVRAGAPIFVEKDVPTISADEDDPDRAKLESRLRRVKPDQLFRRD